MAEILYRLVPLMRAVELEVDWEVIKGSPEFFSITKTIHNGLQGMPVNLSEDMKKTYLLVNEVNANSLTLDHDFVEIHDRQPAPIIHYHSQRPGKWTWRCHIDLSHPNIRNGASAAMKRTVRKFFVCLFAVMLTLVSIMVVGIGHAGPGG